MPGLHLELFVEIVPDDGEEMGAVRPMVGEEVHRLDAEPVEVAQARAQGPFHDALLTAGVVALDVRDRSRDHDGLQEVVVVIDRHAQPGLARTHRRGDPEGNRRRTCRRLGQYEGLLRVLQVEVAAEEDHAERQAAVLVERCQVLLGQADRLGYDAAGCRYPDGDEQRVPAARSEGPRARDVPPVFGEPGVDDARVHRLPRWRGREPLLESAGGLRQGLHALRFGVVLVRDGVEVRQHALRRLERGLRLLSRGGRRRDGLPLLQAVERPTHAQPPVLHSTPQQLFGVAKEEEFVAALGQQEHISVGLGGVAERIGQC